MKNIERYADYIIECACINSDRHLAISKRTGEPFDCIYANCGDCLFISGDDCQKEALKWALRDETEPVDWCSVDINTPIEYRTSSDTEWQWHCGHFAKFENGVVYAWECGKTSWTADQNRCIPVKSAVLTNYEPCKAIEEREESEE